ncbi:MAG: DivIVA domain-containing protein [Bacilli bacterium]|nr:DivIVA domain-containing protein [Bacilli bacterium]
MEKFTKTLRGYDPEEVNSFLDEIIKKVEDLVSQNKAKDQKIADLQYLINENDNLKQKIEQYERMEGTLNKAILMAQKTSEQIKSSAIEESSIIIDDAKKNASRIVNEALLRSEKAENDAALLKRNVNIFKRRLKDIIEAQLNVIEEIDKVEI